MPEVILNRLEILETLGEGSFGRVYRAYDRVLKREVALKEFHRNPGGAIGTSFRTEMELLSRLRHPALVDVYDVLVDEGTGTRYLTQDLVQGEELSNFFERVNWETRAQLLVQLLQGLEYLHQRGVIHLDIKPGNILVDHAEADHRPQAKILDFGISDYIGKFEQKGVVAGTFPFMAPEIARGDSVDGRADLYSLAMTYYKLSGGKLYASVEGESDKTVQSSDTLTQETAARPAPTAEDFPNDVPTFLRDILVTLLQPNPRRRFWSANEVIRRLHAGHPGQVPLEPGRLRLPDKATAVLLGRQEPFQQVCSWFESFLKEPHGLFVGVLRGKPQSGKSALLDEFRRWAELNDQPVIALTGPEDDLGVLFERLLSTPPPPEIGPYAPFLKSLLPKVFSEAPDPQLLDLSPELERTRYLEKWSEVLNLLLVRTPRIILIDDLDRNADVSALLDYVAKNPPSEPGRRPAHAFVLAASGVERGADADARFSKVLELRVWSQDEARNVLRLLLGEIKIPIRLLERLMDKTEGVPGLLIEYLRLLVGEILRPGEDIEGQLDALDWAAVDARMNLSLWHTGEYRSLGNQDQHILSWLCASPGELTEDDLGILDPALTATLASVLRQLADRGWLRKGPRGWQMAGELRRETVRAHLDKDSLASIHLSLGRKWEELSLARENPHHPGAGSVLRRADEFFLGGRPTEGLALARPELEAMLRYHQAQPVVRFLKQHESGPPDLSEADRGVFLKLLAQAHLATANFPEAIGTYRSLLNRASDAEEKLNLAAALARALRYGGELKAATQTILQARQELPADSRHRPPLDALLADILLEQARYEEAEEVCGPYFSGERPSYPEETMAFRHVQAKIHFYRKEMDKASQLFRQNMEESRRAGRLARHALSLNSLGAACGAMGDHDEAIRLYHSCSTLSEEIGDLRGMALAQVNLGVATHRAGEMESSMKHYEKALTVFRKMADRAYEARTLYNLGALHHALENMEGAENAFAESGRLAETLGMVQLQAQVCQARAECCHRRGDLQGALHLSERAAALFDELNMPTRRLAARLKSLEVRMESRTVESPESELQAFEEELKTHPEPRCEVVILYLRARRVRASDASRAMEYLQGAIRKLESTCPGEKDLREQLFTEMARAQSDPKEEEMTVKEEPSRFEPSGEGGSTARFAAESRVSPPPASDAPMPPVLRRKADRQYLSLLDVVTAINSAVDLEDVLIQIVDSLIGFAEAERGFLLLMDGGKLSVRMARTHEKKDIHDPEEIFSLSVAEEAIETRRPVASTDALNDPRFKDSASVYRLRLRSILCVPLFAADEPLGALYLDTRLKIGRFSELDLPVLSALAGLAGTAIYKARLTAQNVRDQRELRRMVRELKDSNVKREELLRQVQEANDKMKDALREREEELGTARRRLEVIAQQEEPKYAYDRIVGSSSAMKRLFLVMDRAVENRVPVLIEGESGTGKELVARAIHYNSRWKDRPFIAVNCSAIPTDLFEAELFGHLRGAFTGADRDKPGLFEAAHGGTLFLDEIGEVPLPLQAKLLRALQDGSFRRVGGTTETQADVRVTAATNIDLLEKVGQRLFREDLYYRLRVLSIRVPPLRERREDIPGLANTFLGQIAKQSGGGDKHLSESALRLLIRNRWQGNVRELENALRTAYVLCRGKEIGVEDFQLPGDQSGGRHSEVTPHRNGLRQALIDFQVRVIEEALQHTGGNVTAAAKELKVDRSQVFHWIKKLKIKHKTGEH